MPTNRPSGNRARAGQARGEVSREALVDALAARVERAAAELADAARRIAGDPTPVGGASAAVLSLRPLLAALVEAAGYADTHAGPGLATVAEAHRVAEATVRRRYRSTPPDLPLLVVLADEQGQDDPDPRPMT